MVLATTDGGVELISSCGFEEFSIFEHSKINSSCTCTNFCTIAYYFQAHWLSSKATISGCKPRFSGIRMHNSIGVTGSGVMRLIMSVSVPTRPRVIRLLCLYDFLTPRRAFFALCTVLRVKCSATSKQFDARRKARDGNTTRSLYRDSLQNFVVCLRW